MIERIRSLLGPLVWGSLVVLLVTRSGDLFFLITKFYLGRKLSLDDFGAIEPINSTVVLLSLPVGILFSAASKSISRLRSCGKDDQAQTLIRDTVVLAGVGSMCVAVVGFLFRDFLLSRLGLSNAAITPVVLALLVIGWWVPMCLAVIRGERRYRLMLLPQGLAPIVIFGATIFFVGRMGFGLTGALIAQVVGWLTCLFVFLLFFRSVFLGGRTPYTEERRVIVKTLVPMAALLGSISLLENFDRLFVRNFLTHDSGGYGAVITLGSIPALLIAPLVFVVYPLAASEHASGREFRGFLKQALLLGGGVTVACVIGAALFGRPVLAVWGAQFTDYAPLLWKYALCMGLQGIVMTIGHVLIARHEYRFLWILVVPVILMCGTLYVLKANVDLTLILNLMLATRCLILAGILLYVYGNFSHAEPVRESAPE